MTRFQILRDIWDKYEARKAAEVEAHNSAFGNAAAQANASASTSQTASENPPPRIQARRRRGAVVDITPPKQLPITGEDTPDDSDNQDFFFVGGSEPAAATSGSDAGSIQRDYDSAQDDRPPPTSLETVSTVQPQRTSDLDSGVQRDTDDTKIVSTIQSGSFGENVSLQRATDEEFDWQPNGMIYMPSNTPVTPETPAIGSAVTTPSVQTKRETPASGGDTPSYQAETQVTPTVQNNPPVIRPKQADTPSVQTQRETDSISYDTYDAPESGMGSTDVMPASYAPDSSPPDDSPTSFESASAITNDRQSDEGWMAQVTPVSAAPASVQPKRGNDTPPVEQQQNPSTTIQTKRNNPTVAASGSRTNTATTALPASQPTPIVKQSSSMGDESATPVVPSVSPSSSQPAIQAKRESPANVAGEDTNITDDFGTVDLPTFPSAFQDAPTTFQQAVNPAATIQPQREVSSSTSPQVEHSDVSHSANPPDLPAGFADAPTSFSMPVAPSIQPQRDAASSAGSPGATFSAPASQPTHDAAVPYEISQPADEAWRAQVTPAQAETPVVQTKRSRQQSGSSDTSPALSGSPVPPALENVPASFTTAANPASSSTIQPKRDSFDSNSDTSDTSYEHWQPSAELAPEPAPDYAPPSPWLNFMPTPETEASASPPVSRVQRKRGTSTSPAANSGNNFTGNTDSPSPDSAIDWGNQAYVQRDIESSDLPEQPVDVFTALFNAGMINERITMPPSQPQNSAPSAPSSVQRQIDPNSSIPAAGSVEAGLLAMLNLPPDTPVAGLQPSKSQTTNAPSQPAAPSISRQMNPAGSDVQRSTGMASVGSMTPPVTTTTTVTNTPAPQDSDSSAIQREITIDEVTTTVSPVDSTNAENKAEVNVDKLAREVYGILKDKLRSEHERKRGV
jgi:hypothetical protein